MLCLRPYTVVYIMRTELANGFQLLTHTHIMYTNIYAHTHKYFTRLYVHKNTYHSIKTHQRHHLSETGNRKSINLFIYAYTRPVRESRETIFSLKYNTLATYIKGKIIISIVYNNFRH